MGHMIGSQAGWIAVPAIILVGAAYVWVVDRLLNRKPQTSAREHAPSVRKAA
jgi:hypothetical protein